jgi:hypothetical protein
LPVVADNKIRSSVANELREREQRRLKSMLPQIVADYVAGMVNADLVAKYGTTKGALDRFVASNITPEQRRAAWKIKHSRVERDYQRRRFNIRPEKYRKAKIAVEVGGVPYPSICAAADGLKIPRSTAWKRHQLGILK